MKNLFAALLAFMLSATTVLAQVPQGISYQAIAFNASGSPVANSNVGVRVSILDNSVTGPAVYTETHIKTTNAQGLYNFNIGQGSPVAGTFNAINWAANSKFLKVEVDPSGGTNYTSVGTNQLMSVPYALFSEKSNTSISSNSITSGNKSNPMIVVYTSTNAYGFYQTVSSGTGYWTSQSLSGTVLGAIASDDNIVVYTTSNAYGFYRTVSSGTGYWTSESLSGTVLGAIASNNNIVVYTTSNAYGFYQTVSSGTGYWTSESLSGSPINAVASNDNIVVYTSSNAYGFYQTISSGTGYWTSEFLSGSPINAIASKQSIVVYTTSNAYGFYQTISSGTGYWTSQSISGTPIGGISK